MDGQAFDRHAAARHVRANARPLLDVVSGQYRPEHCAKRVREALRAGGVALEQTLHAKDYGPSLLRAGFTKIVPPVAPFCAGDVGHMAMFDGADWVSDFVQRDLHGGPAYRAAAPIVALYRRWPTLTVGHRRMFAGGIANTVVLPVSAELCKFTDGHLFDAGEVSPWWTLRFADSALRAAGLDALLLDAQRSERPTHEFVRDRLAVMLNWNSLARRDSGFLRVQSVRLLRPVPGYHGRCAAVKDVRAHSADSRPDPRHRGGAHQLCLPDLTRGDVIGTGIRFLG
jgi:hypothetical protein